MLLITAALAFALSSPARSDVLQTPQPAPEQTRPQAATPPPDQNDQSPDPKDHSPDPTDQSPDPKDQEAEAKKPATPPHTGIRALATGVVEDIAHVPSKRNLYVLIIGGGLAAAAHPADQTFNVHLRSHYDAVNTAFAAGKYFGNTPEQVAMSLGTYAWGRVQHQPKVSHLGMDLLQAQIMSEILVQPLKFITQRQRPDLSDRHSFPSGHSAVTFASATVIERHLGWKKSVLGYVIASYVAASRLHDNVHYLSDVIFGAATGTIAGNAVMHHQPDNWTFAPVNVPGGVAILVSRNTR
jgi:membrane-associated phospholipid phosphatase